MTLGRTSGSGWVRVNMNVVVELVLLAVALVGHSALWIGAINRLHGFYFNRLLVDAVTLLLVASLVGLPLLWLPIVPGLAQWFAGWECSAAWISAANRYEYACIAIAVVAATHRLFRLRHSERFVASITRETRPIELPSPRATMLAPGFPRWLGTLPGNQTVKPVLEELRLAIRGLPADLDGLRIVQLSDLHMSGRVEMSYYHAIVAAANRCEPDLIALTGDIVERPGCMKWLDEILAELNAKHARCFVLGNHDKKVDCDEIRRRLTVQGWHDVARDPIELAIGGSICQIVGNEQPWFAGPPHTFEGNTTATFRLLLAHSPDLFSWAQQHKFQLLLAGHNHGGQIRFPLIGPIVSPSRHGTRYASGVFQQGETTLHVSTGTGSLAPLRWNCPPELSLIVLSSLAS